MGSAAVQSAAAAGFLRLLPQVLAAPTDPARELDAGAVARCAALSCLAFEVPETVGALWATGDPRIPPTASAIYFLDGSAIVDV